VSIVFNLRGLPVALAQRNQEVAGDTFCRTQTIGDPSALRFLH
jgi:hypothetical protein